MGRTSQAAALHRQAVAASLVAAAALETSAVAGADEREQQALAARLRDAAAALVPGWLGTPLDELPPAYPIGAPVPPRFVRVGTACPLDDARFPAVVPLLGTGHLSIDVDGRDTRVAGLLRAVLLRLLAAAPPGSLLVRVVDATDAVFAPFRPLADAGLLAPPATDRAGLATLLAEAQGWARPTRTTAANRHDRSLLLVVAVLPESTDQAELAALDALAQRGPEGGLHLIVAGWPPTPPAPGATRPPLPRATTLALRERYALLGDPPGASFGIPLPYLPRTGLNAPVIIDGDPPTRLLDRLCREFTSRSTAGGVPALVDLLPLAARPAYDPSAHRQAHEPSADQLAPDPPAARPQHRPAGADGSVVGLTTAIGYDRGIPVALGFTDLTPHWLVSGRRRSGKTSFLVTVLLGLSARHGPDELELWLISLADGGSFRRFLPAFPDGRRPLPQLRVLRDGFGPEQALAVLRDLDAERERRLALARSVGVRRLADLPGHRRPARLLCVMDEFQQLATADAQSRDEAFDLLERLSRSGRTLGVHLLLAGRPTLDATRPDQRRDMVFGQFPVRVALPGGDQVLRPDNHAAAGLPLGSAVINTAGGLGGPRGATRGHERLVRFPDPYADPATLLAVRDRIHRSYAGRALSPQPAPVSPPVSLSEPSDGSIPAHQLGHVPAAPAIASQAGEP